MDCSPLDSIKSSHLYFQHKTHYSIWCIVSLAFSYITGRKLRLWLACLSSLSASFSKTKKNTPRSSFTYCFASLLFQFTNSEYLSTSINTSLTSVSMKKGFSITGVCHNLCNQYPYYWAFKLFLVYNYHKQSCKNHFCKLEVGFFGVLFMAVTRIWRWGFFLIWERTPLPNFEIPHDVGFPSREESLCQEKAADRNTGPTCLCRREPLL